MRGGRPLQKNDDRKVGRLWILCLERVEKMRGITVKSPTMTLAYRQPQRGFYRVGPNNSPFFRALIIRRFFRALIIRRFSLPRQAYEGEERKELQGGP